MALSLLLLHELIDFLDCRSPDCVFKLLCSKCVLFDLYLMQ